MTRVPLACSRSLGFTPSPRHYIHPTGVPSGTPPCVSALSISHRFHPRAWRLSLRPPPLKCRQPLHDLPPLSPPQSPPVASTIFSLVPLRPSPLAPPGAFIPPPSGAGESAPWGAARPAADHPAPPLQLRGGRRSGARVLESSRSVAGGWLGGGWASDLRRLLF